jgi:hypothetical protein
VVPLHGHGHQDWVITEGPKMDGHTIEVFSGTCGSLASIWCQGNGDSYIPLTGLTAGDMYYVRVIGYPPFISGTDKTEMGLAVVSDPPHDECAGAIELPVVSAGISAYPATPLCTLGATQSLAACTGDPSSSDDDVWYRFTATGTAHHFSSITQYGTGGMPIIQWFSGACGSLTSLVCDGPMATGLTPGQEYHIRLHSTSTSPDFTLRLNGDVHESALNDECDGALPINVALSGEEPEEVTVSTLLGTSSTVPCDVQPSDVWLTFTAPTDRVAVYTTVGHDLSIFSGSCGSLVCEGEGSTSAFEAEVFDGLTPGSTYFLKMGNALYALGNTRVRIYAAPSNDECGNATQLDVLPAGTGAGFTQGTTYIATTGDPACGITAPPDVWYTFTAMAATHLVSIVFPEYTTSAKMEVLNGTCGSLTSVLCDDVGSQPTPITGLQLGTEYHVRIFTNGAERLVFGIGITEAMVNDECLGATVLPGLPLAAIPNQPSVFPVNATASGSGTCGGSIEDVWYRFTPTATEATFLAAFPYGSSGTFGNYIELLSGTCGSLTPISCVNSVGRNSHGHASPGLPSALNTMYALRQV